MHAENWPFNAQYQCDLGPINLVRVSCPLCCINVNMSYRIQVFLNIHFCSCCSVSTELLVCFNCAHVLLWYCCLRLTAIVFDWHVFIVYSEMYWYSNKLFWIELNWWRHYAIKSTKNIRIPHWNCNNSLLSWSSYFGARYMKNIFATDGISGC